MARIISLAPEKGRIHRLDATENLIGRRLDCHVYVNDQRVSRRHARIRRELDGLQLEDLGSSNGTFVNHRRIHGSVRLRDGDLIAIGAWSWQLDLSDEQPTGVDSPLVSDLPSDLTASFADLRGLGVAVVQRKAATLYEAEQEIERVHRKLQAVHRVAEAVSSTLDPTQMLDRVTSLLLEVFPPSSRATVLGLDAATGVLRARASQSRRRAPHDEEGVRIARGVVDRMLRLGQGVLIAQAADASHAADVDEQGGRRDSDPDASGEGIGWRMGAPLTVRGEHSGVVLLEAEPARGYFTQNDLDLLSGLAAQIAVALHLIDLHQRLLVRDRLDHDLRLARQIQRNLLPRDPPRVAGLEIAVHYEPAFHVGGDFYDFLWRDQQQLSIVVGDVSGKAVSGALFMARVTSEIRSVASLGSPARVIERVNRALAEIADDGMFVTLVYLSIDLRTNTMRFANAGHTIPLLQRGEQLLSLEFDRARSMPVGVLPEIQCDEVEVPLLPGDVLMLYTDGIIEARSMKGEFYGQDRLDAAVASAPRTARGALDAVLRDVDGFVEAAPQADDQTVVSMHLSKSGAMRMDTLLPIPNRPR
ncbi:MAG: SpoIIE family protein phosphatase [Polyangiales bacterium]